MSAGQLGGAIALAVIGFLFVVLSVIARGEIKDGTFGDRLSKAGLLIGSLFILPLVLMICLGIVVGFGPVAP